MITAAHSDVCPLTQFVDHVARQRNGFGPMIVNHAKVAIRDERLSELSDWPCGVLDAIELHVAQFPGEAPLDVVFETPFDRYPTDQGRSVSSICAPSPFAWT